VPHSIASRRAQRGERRAKLAEARWLTGLALGRSDKFSRFVQARRLKPAAFVGAVQTNASDRVSRARPSPARSIAMAGENIGRDMCHESNPPFLSPLASRKHVISIGSSPYLSPASRQPPGLFQRVWPLLSAAFSARARIKAPTMTLAQLNAH